MMRYSIGIVLTMAVLLLSVGSALAEEPVLVDRQVGTVSGAEIAKGIVSSITDVDLGSDGATLTLDVEGEERSMNIDLGGKDDKGAVGGIFGLVAASGVAATAMKVIGKIRKVLH